jgi:glutamine amidotransferase
MNVVVIDYGLGNVRSILNALDKIGVIAKLSNDKQEILEADRIILPGVGAFSHGMQNLHKHSLVSVLKEFASTGKPMLGICLGMQMLLSESEEFGETQGIGLIPGRVVKLPTKDASQEKLPHVSWNEVRLSSIGWEGTVLNDIEPNSDMYFVHSYVAVPDNKDYILATTEYSGHEFCSSVKKDNVYGCQFHPEKSSILGLKIIENFIRLI